MARSWNPDFNCSDRERWVCVYPAYINSKKTVAEGRRIPKNRSVDNPTYVEIRDVLANAGMTVGVENKVYPRELDPRDPKFRGRIRVQLKDENGAILHENFPTRRSVLFYLGETIPKLKARVSAQNASQSSQQSQQSNAQKRQRGKKKK
ncbi:signal recognition particle 19 kDa protein-like [Tubulanus polymorphus]|uniref:signal recognition particle 19 kDa protein-like n=1 Tax=Tubulanus polymorphus TaxID=672921 RepID=UPI003DA3F5FA